MTHSDRGPWSSLRFPDALRLPGLLDQLANRPTWTASPGFPLDPLWEEVGFATFDAGDVPDAAYAFPPALLDVATRSGRSARDAAVVIGYVVDATLGALPGACDIPSDLGPGFLACLETSRRIALGVALEGLPEGQVSMLVSARLLSESGLAASYAVSASRSEVQLVCPACRGVVLGELSPDGWALTSAEGQTVQAVAGEISQAWRRSVAGAVAPLVGILAVAEQLLAEPAFDCPDCRRRVRLGQGVAAAVAALPVVRYSWHRVGEPFVRARFEEP